MTKSKGFTIIELIVVIAIIAVLASIVLINVTSYINKGKNAAIKGNLASIMTNAAVWIDSVGDYGSHAYNGATATTFCLSSLVAAPEAAITSKTGAQGVDITVNNWKCQNNTAANGTIPIDGAFCACAMEIPANGATGTVFCVDSTGAKVEKVGVSCSAECVSATGICTP